MNTRRACSLYRFVLPCLSSFTIFAVLASGQFARAAERAITVNVDPGKTKTQNVGCGFNDLSDAVYELTIEVTSQYTIVETGIDEQAGDSVLWQRDANDITKFHIVGVDPNKRFWVVIWAKLLPPGETEGEMIRWMSVSDLDADADTDNNSTACPRIPSASDTEDFAEYPGYQAPPTVPGIVIGVNDDHDEFPFNGQLWGYDRGNAIAVLNESDKFKDGTSYGGWSVGLAQIKVQVGVKRAPGDLKFTIPETIRLFEGEEGKKGDPFAGDRSKANGTAIATEGDHPFVFYMEGKQPYQEPQQLVISYDPEGQGQGKAQDTITVLPVQMDLDVDSDNDGTITSSDDPIEAKPEEIGMIVPTSTDPENGKPGILRGLFSQQVTQVLDNVQTNPVIRLGRISGDGGHVCVWKVRAGQDPVLMLDTSQSTSTTTDGDGNTLFQLLGDASDHDILITGVTPGEVLLGLQLTVNGAKVAMDVVRITALVIDLDVDSDNNDLFNLPDRSPYEESVEDSEENSQGKYVVINDGDVDVDGIPDYADGFSMFGPLSTVSPDVRFVPVVLEIPEAIDLSTASLRIIYPASDPNGVTQSEYEGNYVYNLPFGSLRLWTVDGGTERDPASFVDNGHYVPSNSDGWYGPSEIAKLGFSTEQRFITFYLEAVDRDAYPSRIVAQVHPDPSRSGLPTIEDAVRVTGVYLHIAMDGNHDRTVDFNNSSDQRSLFWLNDDHDAKYDDGDQWVEDDREGTPDWDDDTIGRSEVDGENACLRDLEDFTQLHIQADAVFPQEASIVLLFDQNGPGDGEPQANIFEAIDNSFDYLTSISIANEQLTKLRHKVVTDSPTVLPGLNVGVHLCYLLEGRQAGKRRLRVNVLNDGHVVGTKSMELELRTFNHFYERYVAGMTGDDVDASDGGQINPVGYLPGSDAYILFVHGWNMSEFDKKWFAETMFKRLWWRGYRGRMGSFEWPTLTGSTTYDRSEWRAWQSGNALRGRLFNLNVSYPGKIRLLAHSMGNVVTGEALRLPNSQPIHTYIAAQAAISAHCYDNTLPNSWDDFVHPHIHGRWFSGVGTDEPYLEDNKSHIEHMVSYINHLDYALDLWRTNNEWKPIPGTGYGYTEGDDNIDSYFPDLEDRFYRLLTTLTIPANRYEVFSRILQSRSGPLGQLSQVDGFLFRDLANAPYGFDEKPYSHSREFRSNIVVECPFWSAVIEDASLD